MSEGKYGRTRVFHSYASTTALRVVAIIQSIAIVVVSIILAMSIQTISKNENTALVIVILIVGILLAILIPAALHVFVNMSDDLKLTGEVIDDLEDEVAEQKAMLTRYMKEQKALMTRLTNMQQGLNQNAFTFFNTVTEHLQAEKCQQQEGKQPETSDSDGPEIRAEEPPAEAELREAIPEAEPETPDIPETESETEQAADDPNQPAGDE